MSYQWTVDKTLSLQRKERSFRPSNFYFFNWWGIGRAI